MKLITAALVGITLTQTASGHAQVADTTAAVAAAEAAAGPWLALIDGARYEQSWDSAASLFRGAVVKAAWEEAVRKARAPFATFGARKLTSASFHTALPGAPPGEYVVLQYETEVGSGGAVVETVTPMKDQDGVWRVSGYYIRPA